MNFISGGNSFSCPWSSRPVMNKAFSGAAALVGATTLSARHSACSPHHPKRRRPQVAFPSEDVTAAIVPPGKSKQRTQVGFS